MIMNRSEYSGFTQVFRFTFIQAWKSNALKITTILLVVLMLLCFPVMSYFQNDGEEEYNIEKVYVTGNLGINAEEITEGLESVYEGKIPEFVETDKTKDELVEQISEEHSNEVIMIADINEETYSFEFRFYSDPDSGVSDSETYTLAENVTDWFDEYRLHMLDADEEISEMINKPVSYDVTDISKYSKDDEPDIISQEDYMIVYVILMVSYMVIIMSSNMVASKVIEEKANRVVEYLMTTVRPMALVTGKIVAMLLSAVIEFGLILGAGLVSSKISEMMFETTTSSVMEKYISMDIIKNISVPNMIACILFFAIGIYMYGLVAGLFGASVSKMEDLQQGTKAYSMIVLIAFLLSLTATEMMWTIGINGFVKAMLLIPFTSVFLIPGAIIIGKVGIVYIIIAVVLQLVTIVIIQKLVSLIYETIIVMNGNPIKPVEMFRIAKQAAVRGRRSDE